MWYISKSILNRKLFRLLNGKLYFGGEYIMVSVSELAAEKLKEIVSKQKNSENIYLRIEFGGYG